jgi:hypothetical protein
MPGIATQVRTQLGIGDQIGLLGEELRWGRLVAGTAIGKIGPLFPRKVA